MTSIPGVIQESGDAKEAAQIFVPGASDHCLWQGASEGQQFAAKSTPAEPIFQSRAVLTKGYV